MNQPYARVNQPYATLTLASALREMFAVQLYKNNARVLLSRILSILNLDWLQYARSVRGVYEWAFITYVNLGEKYGHGMFKCEIVIWWEVERSWHSIKNVLVGDVSIFGGRKRFQEGKKKWK